MREEGGQKGMEKMRRIEKMGRSERRLMESEKLLRTVNIISLSMLVLGYAIILYLIFIK